MMRPWACDMRWSEATAAASPALTGVLVTKGPIRLHEVRLALVASAMTADVYLMLFDDTAPPKDGDVPKHRIALPAGAIGGSETMNYGMVFEKGVSYGYSSTAARFTGGALANSPGTPTLGYLEPAP